MGVMNRTQDNRPALEVRKYQALGSQHKFSLPWANR